MLRTLRRWARRIRAEVITLWFAMRHARTPRSARLLGALVVAYALSPIDLIPDVIPVLGLLDDMVVLPALIWLALRLLPPDVHDECREQAAVWVARGQKLVRSIVGAAIVVGLWIAVMVGLWMWLR